jgi:hypothetical protein
MVVLNGRAGWPRRPGRRIGGIVTLAMMPDRWDILGDPGPVRVSPSLSLLLGPICRMPGWLVGCSSSGLQTCA